ncbi:hypothetical protein J5N97_003243 [Dioscorea zingiberensis]|uniref:Uncharacterized protein n=1 Tax=Dioscorea zingiberensis TaxID=325984 RepID=A0A9D5HR34_9LILI|nr:hypothetical protein J5N97_003243 [Dioscorea zingiberensis]
MAARFLLLQRLKRLQLSPLLHSALIPNQSITSHNNPVLSNTLCHFSKISIPPSPFRNSLPFRRFPTAEARIKYKIEKMQWMLNKGTTAYVLIHSSVIVV